MTRTVFKSRGYLGLRSIGSGPMEPWRFRWELLVQPDEIVHGAHIQPGPFCALGFTPGARFLMDRSGSLFELSLQQACEFWYLHQHCRLFLNQPGEATPYYRLRVTVAHRGSQGSLIEEGIRYASHLAVESLTFVDDVREFFAHDVPSEDHAPAHELYRYLVSPWIGAMRLSRVTLPRP